MICTVSLNPAVDKYLRLPQLRRGQHQQAAEVITSAGGKAINVAGVLRALGSPVLLLGFFGGYTGNYLLEEVQREGIEADPVLIPSATRTAFVLVEEDAGVETELVEPGAPVTGRDIDALRAKLREAARRCPVVVLSGSAPPGCPDDIYRQLLADCDRHCQVLLDTSKQWLQRALEGNPLPTLIKPNRHEAEQFAGKGRFDTAADIAAWLRGIQQKGVSLPAFSDGDAGLYACHNGRALHARPPRLQRVNSVGSGDATIAGFALALSRGDSFPEAVRLAAACGAANVLTKECAQVHGTDVERLLASIQLTDI